MVLIPSSSLGPMTFAILPLLKMIPSAIPIAAVPLPNVPEAPPAQVADIKPEIVYLADILGTPHFG